MANDIRIDIDADGSKAKKELDQVASAVDKVAKEESKYSKSADLAAKATESFEGASMGAVAAAGALGAIVGTTLGSAFAMVGNQIENAIKRVDTLNNFPRVMANMKISSEDASKSINVLSDKLQGLPTSLDDAAASVQRFTAANGNIQASTAMVLALNNAILAGGASTQVQTSALEQMSQAYTKGKADTMEWRAMLQAMPAQMNQIAKAMGYTSSAIGGDLYNAMQSGKVSMNQFMAAIVQLNNKGVDGFASFEDQARASTNGISTSMTNMRLAIQRGIAEIIQAIGQTNLANFFAAIGNAINTALSYVAAFVKVCATAINALRTLFGAGGGSSAKSTANALATASGGASSLSNNATGASKALGSANKQAKQLKNTLASFDEMNVLKEPQQAEGGGGSGGGGGAGVGDLSGIDFGNLWGQLDAGESKVDKIFAKMQKAINKIDFSKWPKALNEFKKGVETVGTIISNTGKSAWNNFFMPLAQHIAEDTIPKWLEGIGQAFQRLDVSSWTKGFDSLFSGRETYWEGLIDSITAVGVAVSNVFTTMANIVVPPALSAIGAIFQMIGTVLQGIGEGFTTVWQGIIEPSLASFAEFMQPVVDHLQTFFEKLSQCEPLMNTLKVVGQALGVVLGAAFTAIVGAVQAVIGAVMLLIDGLAHLLEFCGFVIGKIGEFFADLGKNIGDIFNNVGQFIKSVFEGIWNAIVTIFTPVVNFFSGIFKAVGDVFTGAWNGLKNGAQGAWNAIKNIFSGVANFFGTIFGNAWNAVKNVFSTGGRIFMGIVDGIANAFKTIVNAIITGINKVVAVPFNAINGMLNVVRGIDILGFKPFSWVGQIGVPQIPKLARGGVVDGPTLAMIGENGSEAVIPLENNTGWIDQLAEKLGENQNDNPTQIIVKLGDETIMDKIIDGVNEKSLLSGRNAIAV